MLPAANHRNQQGGADEAISGDARSLEIQRLAKARTNSGFQRDAQVGKRCCFDSSP